LKASSVVFDLDADGLAGLLCPLSRTPADKRRKRNP
jgi:hypothetical protein